MNNTELELTFPLNWEYKVIALDSPEIRDALTSTLQGQGLDSEPIPGQRSKNGKYRTYLVQAQLDDRKSLANLARALSECPGVKFLL